MEVAHLKVADGVLTADVRNGLKEAAAGLTVTLQLFGLGDSVLKTVDIPVGNLKPGEIKPVSAEVGDVGTIMGWGVGFSFGAGPSPAPAQQDAGDDGAKAGVLNVDGVTLEMRDLMVVGTAVKLDLTLTNTRDADLKGLSCELKVQDAAGTEITIPVTVGDLAAGASFEGSVVGEGIGDVAGLAMTWATGG